MSQFNTSDDFNLPSNATSVTATIRLTKPGKAPITQTTTVTTTENSVSQTIAESTFQWTFDQVPQESGTFVDGSPWVVFPAGSSPRLIDVSPRPEINVVQETSAGGGDLTIYRNGFIVNPKLGTISSTVDDFINGVFTTEKPLFADNRNNSVFSEQDSVADIQEILDENFDIDGFTQRKDAIESGAGIPLNTNDVIALSQSFFDENDNRPYNASSSYLPFVGQTLVYHDSDDNEVNPPVMTNVSARTAIKNQAVLTVLETAPANDSYRPPVYWPSGVAKPMFDYSLTRSVSDGSEIMNTLGHDKNISVKNRYPWKRREYRDTVLIGPVLDAGGEGTGSSYSSAKALSNLSAYYYKDLNYGGTKTSPLLLGLFNHMTNTRFGEDERESVARRLIQYGIDEYGKAMCLTKTGGGAGQRAGLMKQWALFAMYMLGQGVRSMEELITEIHPDFDALSPGDKSEFLQRKFQEDTTVKQVYQDASDPNIPVGERDADLRYLSNMEDTSVDPDKRLGNCYNENLDMTKFVRAETFEVGAGVSLNYTKSATNFEIPADSDLPGPGFGQLVFSGVPITYPGADKHSDNAVNLIGCRLIVDGTDEYTIIEMTYNMGKGESGQEGERYIVVERPFDTEITSSTEIRLKAFRPEDAGGYFYFREGVTRRNADRPINDNSDFSCPSLHNDGYCQITWSATFGMYAFLLRAYKEIDGLVDSQIESKLGVWYKWYRTYFTNTLGPTSLPRNWQFNHGRKFKLGTAQVASSFDWISTYYTPTVLPGVDDTPPDDDDFSWFLPEDSFFYAPIWKSITESTPSWQSLSTLQSLIDGTPDNGTLDLTGQYFCNSGTEAQVTIPKPVNITGGHILGGKVGAWTSVGNGVFRDSTVTESVWNNTSSESYPFLQYCVDPQQDFFPLLAVTPVPPLDLDKSRFSVNDNWWKVKYYDEIDNGVVTTDAAGDILSFTITDSALKTDIEANLQGETVFACLYWSSDNRVYTAKATYDSSTGTVEFEEAGADYNGNYLYFAAGGMKHTVEAQPGTYGFDFSGEGSFLYHPTNGDPSQCLVSTMPTLISFSSESDGSSFTNTIFMLGTASSGAPGMLKGTGEPDPTITFSHCRVGLAHRPARNQFIAMMDMCDVSYCNRGWNTTSGARITRSRFRYMENSSNFATYKEVGATTNTFTEVSGNIFTNPTSTHGQCISAYNDSWQLMDIKNNIFYNSKRFLAFQPDRNEANRVRDPGVFNLENNIWLLNTQQDSVNQQGLSFNGKKDTHLNGLGQVVNVRNNTVVAHPDFTDNQTNMSLDVRKLEVSEVNVFSNLFYGANAPEPDETLPVLPHNRYNNAIWGGNPLNGQATGSTDFDFEGQEPLSTEFVLNPAMVADNRGHQWTNTPPLDRLDDLRLDWSDFIGPVDPQNFLPDPTQVSQVFFG